MKVWWAIQAARIDALSLRERAFLFLSIVVCVIALVDFVWLEPIRREHTQTRLTFNTESAELDKLRKELLALPAPVDVNAAMRMELAQARMRTDSLDKVVKEMSVAAGTTGPLDQVLSLFLRRYPNLTLVQISTLAPTPPATAASAGAPAPIAVVRRGVEMTVSGPYAELIRMVQSLEIAMPTLRWGSMRLSADKQPPTLSLQVFVLGDQS